MKPINEDYMKSEVFQKLFGTLHIPNLLADFDAIGFDGDFTLLDYNVREQQILQYKATAEVLVNKRGYPAVLLEIKNSDFDCAMNNVLMDGNTGCIVKLAPGNLVISGYLGYRKLSYREICDIYSTPPIIKDYNMLLQTDLTKNYMSAATYFKYTHTILFQKIIDLIVFSLALLIIKKAR